MTFDGLRFSGPVLLEDSSLAVRTADDVSAWRRRSSRRLRLLHPVPCRTGNAARRTPLAARRRRPPRTFLVRISRRSRSAIGSVSPMLGVASPPRATAAPSPLARNWRSINTPFLTRYLEGLENPAAGEAEIKSAYPLERWAEPKEIADAIPLFVRPGSILRDRTDHDGRRRIHCVVAVEAHSAVPEGASAPPLPSGSQQITVI